MTFEQTASIEKEEHDHATYTKRVSVIGSIAASFSGNVTLNPSNAHIGSVSIFGTISTGMNTLFPSPNFIGLTTTVIGSSPTLFAVVNTGAVGNTNSLATLLAGPNSIGSVTLNNSNANIGSVSVLGGAISVSNFVAPNVGNVTLNPSSNYIGNVTAWALNAGTPKTLEILPWTLSTSSIATIAVPSGGNAIFKMTNTLINSNATVRVNIKSGPTYLTGNVSLGINLNPGGGWVENGSPDSPVYFGLASGAAIVLEKADFSGVISQVSGKVIYFAE